MKYFDHDITLVDKFDRIIQVWKWLQKCSVNDILALPIMKVGEKISDYNLSEDETNFMHFLVQVGSHGYSNTVSARGENYMPRQIKKCVSNYIKLSIGK